MWSIWKGNGGSKIDNFENMEFKTETVETISINLKFVNKFVNMQKVSVFVQKSILNI